jgi:hypothetical protein
VELCCYMFMLLFTLCCHSGRFYLYLFWVSRWFQILTVFLIYIYIPPTL